MIFENNALKAKKEGFKHFEIQGLRDLSIIYNLYIREPFNYLLYFLWTSLNLAFVIIYGRIFKRFLM